MAYRYKISEGKQVIIATDENGKERSLNVNSLKSQKEMRDKELDRVQKEADLINGAIAAVAEFGA